MIYYVGFYESTNVENFTLFIKIPLHTHKLVYLISNINLMTFLSHFCSNVSINKNNFLILKNKKIHSNRNKSIHF